MIVARIIQLWKKKADHRKTTRIKLLFRYDKEQFILVFLFRWPFFVTLIHQFLRIGLP